MGKEGSGVTCLRRDLNKCPRALGSCGSAWRLGSACWDCTGLELEVASRSGAFPLPHPSSSTEGSGTQGGPLFRASCYPRPLIYLTSEPSFASPPRIARSHRVGTSESRCGPVLSSRRFCAVLCGGWGQLPGLAVLLGSALPGNFILER